MVGYKWQSPHIIPEESGSTICLERICCDIFSTYFYPQFRKVVLLVLQECGKYCVIIGGRWTTLEILGCAIDLVDGAQCKCKRKRWCLFYTLLWTCRETDYFRRACELVGWLTIAKYQALEMFYETHARAAKGVIGEGKSVSWGGAQTKGVNKRELTKKVFLHNDLLTSLSSSLTQLFSQFENSCCEVMG